ncbi:GntR family transcriptional regulator [Lactobacillus sp. ESL0684]|uniref:GntR family transcriptional regulator n=1 Tax=unclassified Lactobacillus TaxID=2620435 RepID=UPI0023F67EA3|nr:MULTISPECIES: GntR family transcriptional regulator [unclassified Lactobacillus]WEV40149.1 GntR family transcriptional regulator [Lactobacillus sp. ESL0681]WEV43329.1 GntR family transcriptional regulator [Lactobacillus sp. ESL0684]
MEPKYKQVERFYIDQINKGKLNIGDQLPPEVEIGEKYGYSRMTVNKALKNLEKEGYVTRIAGRGTFVKSKNVLRVINDDVSFTEFIKRQEMTPGSTLLSYELVEDTSNYLDSNDFDSEQNYSKLHHFKRLRTGNQKPIAITDDYLNAEIVKHVEFDLLNNSLYAYLKKLKLPVIQNFVEIKAIKATKKQQELLNLKEDFLLKTLENTDTILTNGERVALGVFTSYYNPNLYTYRFNI